MATINYALKEISYKIVYYGCGMCGKTTNLQVIHSLLPGAAKGNLVSLATQQDRTLFFDFLPVDLGSINGLRARFQVYTTPGQSFYSATRKIVLRGADGVVFVVDSQWERMRENLESWQSLTTDLAEHGYDITTMPIVVQYNKRDLPNVAPVDYLQRLLNPEERGWHASIASSGEGVINTLKAVSKSVLLRAT
jgi:signal recognition particle receptor subunit beta